LSASQNSTRPPLDRVTIASTWDELLLYFFPTGLPMTGAYSFNHRILSFLKQKILDQFPDAQIWATTAAASSFPEYEAIKTKVRLQFQGLGLVRVLGIDNGGNESWELTDHGKLHCALVAGQRRTASAANVKS